MENNIVEFSGDNYEIVTTFSRGNILYIAMQKVQGEGDEESVVELYRFREIADGIEIIPIETELEFEKAAEIFAALQEENEDGE